VGVVSHWTLRPTGRRWRASAGPEHIAPEQLVISSDCGFSASCNREIAFFKTTAIAQGSISWRELGGEGT
jgi:hypothetical protein